jgi:hypothetical protein
VDEIMGIISVDFEAANQLLITHSAVVKCLNKVGIKWGSRAALYRFQESL